MDRRGVRGLLLALLPTLLLVAVAVGPALLGQRVFLAGDLIEQAAPWRETTAVDHVVNTCVHDTIDSAMPSQLAFRDRAAAGEWPDFEPRTSAGHTLGATPAVGTSSPLFLATLPFSDATFTAWLKVAEIVVAVVGVGLWGRRIGVSTPAGVLGGFLFVTSGFMLMWTNWPQTRTAVFFPLLFWAVERIVQERTWHSALPLPLVVAAAALGGFPAIVVHAAYAAALYGVVRLVVENRAGAGAERYRGVWRRWLAAPVLALAGGAVALGLVAVQLVPWAAQLAAQDLAFREAWWARTVEPSWLATVPFAQGLGTCASDARWWGGPTIPVEAVSFVGAGALVLLGAAAVLPARSARGVRGVLAAVALLAFAMTFLGGPLNEALHHLPGMGGSFLARSRAVGGLCLAVLAAIGFDAAVRGPVPQGPRRVAALALALGVPAAVTATALWLRHLAPDGAPWEAVRASVLLSVAAAWLVGGAWAASLLAARCRPDGTAPAQWRAALAVLTTLAVAAEGVVAARAWWPLAPTETFYRETETSAYLRDHLGDGRIMGAVGTYNGSATTVHELRALSGHNFVPPAWAGLVRQADPDAVAAGTGTLVWLTDLAALDSPVMERLAVRYAVADTTAAPPGERRGWDDRASGRAVRGEARRPVDDAPIRAVAVELATAAGEAPRCTDEARLSAEVRDTAGAVLARGERGLRADELHRAAREGGVPAFIALDPVPDVLRRTQAEVTVRVSGCADLPLGAAAGRPDAWAGVVVGDGGAEGRCTDDAGLRLVPPSVTRDALVLENPGALPRIRWASDSAQCETLAACGRAMGRVDDATVLLHPADAAAVSFAGRPARIEVLRDAGDEQVVRVHAEGDGMLVVADSVQPGWTARLDGERVALRTVDAALRGVAVPAGEHEVRLTFEPVGRGALGPLAIASAAVWLAGAVLLGARGRGAARRTRRGGRRHGLDPR